MDRLGALISGIYHRRPERPDAPPPEPPSTPNPRRGVPVVRLLPGHQPSGEVEHHLCAVLARGPLPLDALVDEVADRLLRAEVNWGGWAADIGVLGPDAYRTQAASVVRALNGLMLCIDPPSAYTP